MKEWNKILAPMRNPFKSGIDRLKEKVLIGHRIFLFDPLKPITLEEIE